MPREWDFVVSTNNPEAIQVCWELNDANRDREIGGLMEAMHHFNLTTGLILTNAREEDIDIDGKCIKVRPVWKWALTLEP